VAKVLVGVTGGIAAYKAPGVIRRLREAGHEVKAIATEAAFRFIPEETLAIAAGERVHTDEKRTPMSSVTLGIPRILRRRRETQIKLPGLK
jgi:phosphopantothenoylcysteine synthetase/decarboxylase